jgi:delta 1-pyrroline-5-carboxylate dehydrogenase
VAPAESSCASAPTFSDARIIIVYTLAHAIGALKAAARAARPAILLSAPDAGIYAGPGWFGAIIEAAREAVPGARFSALLDCGDRPGAALAAIRAHIEGVIFTGRTDVGHRLADLAAQHGVRLVTDRPAAGLDLGDDFFASAAESEQRCAEFLAYADTRDEAC